MNILIKSFLFFSLTLTISNFTFAQKTAKVNQKKPDKVAIEFSKRVANLDFVNAQKLSTEESSSMFDLMNMAMSILSPEDLKKAKDETSANVKNIKSAKCEIDGDNATCVVCCNPSGENSGEALNLKKIKGKWYIHWVKEDLDLDGSEEEINTVEPEGE